MNLITTMPSRHSGDQVHKVDFFYPIELKRGGEAKGAYRVSVSVIVSSRHSPPGPGKIRSRSSQTELANLPVALAVIGKWTTPDSPATTSSRPRYLPVV